MLDVSPQPQLDARLVTDLQDPLLPIALLSAEVVQRRETGYDVDDLVVAANALETNDDAGILGIVDAMAAASRGAWPWEEPETLGEIRDAIGNTPRADNVTGRDFRDAVHAGWLGRIAGCNLGKPLEWGDHWTPAHIADYLELAGAYPLRDYVPVLEPMPERFELNESWPEAVRGRINGGARDDDVDYAIFALWLLERRGRDFGPDDVGELWTEMLPLRQTYTAERAAYINLARGLRAPETARFRNPYREWIGAQIRGDVFGYVNPGDPWAAASLAYQDATLSHTGNGVYGEMWSAALVAAAFTAADARDAITRALAVVPPRSRLAAAIGHVIHLSDSGTSWEAALAEVRATYGEYSWVHTINNAANVAVGLLWSEGDFAVAIGNTVMGGWDTDSDAATVGSVAGILAGTAGIPAHLADPLHDRTRSALFGFDNSRISDLAARTSALAER
ncbi:ADP-ribosylglycohydrolase family protein [Microbacterium insulae]|uniref:ADP-ribosylglycohydrolase family protein n=1 Tax=Microbacterium insulae TaxID=483014 RepID=A0ABW3AH91_9MICO